MRKRPARFSWWKAASSLLLPLFFGSAVACSASTSAVAAPPELSLQDQAPFPLPASTSPGTPPVLPEPPEAAEEPTLLLKFFDVGQGDAVLIHAPSGQAVLYDGGRGGRNLAGRLRALGIGSLDLVIASHNHADHIGGLPEVIREFRPRFVMENGIPHPTGAYRRFLESIEAAGSQLLEPERRVIGLGEAQLHVLPPKKASGWAQNDNSIGVIVNYGGFRASLTGDAEAALFAYWLTYHRDLLRPVHIHKASHHGSRNGDTRGGIQALQPEVVVIGVSARNGYGHPHGSALNLYRSVGATVYRTDRDGSVLIEARPSGRYTVVTGREASAAPLPPRAPPAVGANPHAQPQTVSACVDLNRASAQELQRIKHIGPERAAQIVPGTTSRGLVTLLREASAREGHFRRRPEHRVCRRSTLRPKIAASSSRAPACGSGACDRTRRAASRCRVS
jgi:competence protein ComEC